MTPRTPRTPTAPAGLDAAGRALWREVAGAYDLDHHEIPILVEACRLADRAAELEAAIEADGLTVTGSAGQPRLNPAVAEVRQTRVALTRCLGAIAFPGEDGIPQKAASRHGRKAAVARWRSADGA